MMDLHDGDAITCLDETNQQQKVRLAAIDAPEVGQEYGRASREALAALQEQARSQKIGLWSQPDPIPPWQYRNQGPAS